MRLQPPDCGDNSCHFAESRGGMRTNGGCRCGDERKQGPGSLSWYARQLLAKLSSASERIVELEAWKHQAIQTMEAQAEGYEQCKELEACIKKLEDDNWELRQALALCATRAGIADPNDACRMVIATVREALGYGDKRKKP